MNRGVPGFELLCRDWDKFNVYLNIKFHLALYGFHQLPNNALAPPNQRTFCRQTRQGKIMPPVVGTVGSQHCFEKICFRFRLTLAPIDDCHMCQANAGKTFNQLLRKRSQAQSLFLNRSAYYFRCVHNFLFVPCFD